MSRFDVNKFITFVEAADEQVHQFSADPATYVARWVEKGEASRIPIADGGPLSDSERTALAEVDYVELYQMGAHPYVLWHFAEAVLVWAGELTWPELSGQFRSAVTEFGNPDFST